jgi:uncharacterized protein (TIGR00369 family)
MRNGRFWDFVEGRSAAPPIAQLLGFELLAVDPDEMTIEVGFTATEAFVNPAGDVQGGMLCAMLDDTLGPALVATLGDGEWAPTTDLHVQFLAPARPGALVGRGRVVRRGRRLVATAVATAAIRRTRAPDRGDGEGLAP